MSLTPLLSLPACAPPPAPVNDCRLELTSYKILQGEPDVDLHAVGKTMVGGMEVEVIDPVEVSFMIFI